MREALALANMWRENHNHERPHSLPALLTSVELRRSYGQGAAGRAQGQTSGESLGSL
ncbi:hypothetical protein CMK11_18935 [Candidatus Poribacteria bacterium]|nr:hypothetical protein [Candidatus Poribacteria bacterium]